MHYAPGIVAAAAVLHGQVQVGAGDHIGSQGVAGLICPCHQAGLQERPDPLVVLHADGLRPEDDSILPQSTGEGDWTAQTLELPRVPKYRNAANYCHIGTSEMPPE
jgi:hypothetical protein